MRAYRAIGAVEPPCVKKRRVEEAPPKVPSALSKTDTPEDRFLDKKRFLYEKGLVVDSRTTFLGKTRVETDLKRATEWHIERSCQEAAEHLKRTVAQELLARESDEYDEKRLRSKMRSEIESVTELRISALLRRDKGREVVAPTTCLCMWNLITLGNDVYSVVMKPRNAYM